MKTIFPKTAAFIASLFLFFACEDDKVDYGLGEYYQDIGTVLNDSAYLLDNGTSLYNAAFRENKVPEAGKRVFLTYSFIAGESFLYDRKIVLRGASEIVSGDLKTTSKAAIDSFSAHPVFLESVWVGSHYLNMQFYFEYKSKAHSIGLFADSTRLNADTVHLYFIHDTNADSPGYPTHLFLSFDLGKVLGNPSKNTPLSVNINTSNYGNKEYRFDY